MARTVSDLINGSLRLLGVLANGENAQADQQTDAFNALSDMLDSMSNERLVIYSILREVFVLSGGQASYTFGTGGNFNSARPQKIENAGILLTTTSPPLEKPIRILNDEQYAEIRVKTVQSGIPVALFNDNANPLANIIMWPVPTSAVSLVTYSWKPLGSFATITTPIVLPPGYLRMLKYNLAVEIAPEYGREPSDVVEAIAIKSMRNIKRMNTKKRFLKVDPALSDYQGAFNWLTGDTV